MKRFLQLTTMVFCSMLLCSSLSAQFSAEDDGPYTIPGGGKEQLTVIANDMLDGTDPMDITVIVESQSVDGDNNETNDIIETSGTDICYTAVAGTAPGVYTFTYSINRDDGQGGTESSTATVTVNVSDMDNLDPVITCPPSIVLLCEPECVCMDFSQFDVAANEAFILNSIPTPQGPVGVFGHNPLAQGADIGQNHAAVVNTDPAPNADPDLGSPNQAFGGTGVGAGGGIGLYQNSIDIGNVLVVNTDRTNIANDACCNFLNDELFIEFDFQSVGDNGIVEVKSVDIFDLDDNAQAEEARFEFYDENDVLIQTIEGGISNGNVLPATGNNGYVHVIIDVPGVRRAVWYPGGSGSLANVCFTAEEHTPTGSATATDDSSTPTIRFIDDIDQICEDDYTVINRTWIALDCAGNSATCSQTITSYDDNGAPEVESCPEDIEVDCRESAPDMTGTPVFSDDCADALDSDMFDITVTLEETNGGDICNGTVTRLWTATDACDNTATCQQVVTTIDTSGPIIVCPPNLDLACDDVSTDLGMASATDECNNVVSLTFEDLTVVDPNCPNNSTLTRTYTATDDCDNTKTCVQVVTYTDNVPPIITCPDMATIECTVMPIPANTNGLATAMDNCGAADVTFEDSIEEGDCDGESTITRTWIATDVCGLTSQCVQTIDIVDTAPPVIMCPPTMNVECDVFASSGGMVVETFAFTGAAQTWMVPAGVTSIMIEASGAQGGGGNFSTFRVGAEGGRASGMLSVTPGEILNIYVGGQGAEVSSTTTSGGGFNGGGDARGFVTDTRGAGGGASDVRQGGTDLTDRVIVAGGGGGTCGVNNDGGAGGGLEGQDAVQANNSAGGGGTQTQGGVLLNPGGNTDCLPGTFGFGGSNTGGSFCSGGGGGWYGGSAGCGAGGGSSYIDGVTSGMTMTGGHQGNGVVTISYGSTGFDSGTASAMDACTEMIDLTFEDSTMDGDCPQNFTITRLWTATDDCGNSSTCSQTIVVDDTTPPSITCPAADTINCDVFVPGADFGSPVASDNCDMDLDITDVTVETPGTCDNNFIIEITYTATDDCMNTNTCAQIITVQDTTSPVCVDVTIELDCSAPTEPVDLYPFTGLESDNCSDVADITIDFDKQIEDAEQDCPANRNIRRSFLVVDECFNTASCVQTLKLRDTTPPALTCPANATIECTADTSPSNPDLGMATATDDCSSVTMSSDDVTSGDNCLPVNSIMRTWTAVDDCGNGTNCVQMIMIEDSQPPVIVCPADTVVDCNTDISPAVLGSATATDLCDPNPMISVVGTPTDGACPQEFVMTRVWTATDCSGNESMCTQTITVQDTVAPMIECTDQVTIECSILFELDVTFEVTDNCDDDVDVSDVTVETVNGCPNDRTLTITFTATDDCLNESTCVTVVNIVDTQGPVISCDPQLIEAECSDDLSPAALGMASATDNCGMVTDITFEDLYCDIEDLLIGFVGPFAQTNWSATTEADAQVIPDGFQTVTLVSANDGTDNAEANYSITFPYDAVIAFLYDFTTFDGPVYDPFGFTIDGQFTTLIDPLGDIDQSGVGSAFVRAGQTFSFTQRSTDAIAGSGVSTVVQILTIEPTIDSPDDLDCEQYVLKRVWTATDDCGNESQCVQGILVDDTTPPALVCADDTTIECMTSFEPSVTGMSTAVDACSTPVDITFEDVIDDDNCNGSIMRTWTATDACGNDTMCTQTILIFDTTDPIITCPANETVECGMPTGPDATGDASGSDNCTDDVTVSSFDTFVEACGATGTISRFWTVSDECDNSAFCTQTITIVDNTPPSIECPDAVVVDCDKLEELDNTGTATASDDCSPPVDVTFEDATVQDPNCPQASVVTRTWTATDACGNTNTCDQIITVQDTTAPVCMDVTIEMECDEYDPNNGPAYTAFSDNCGMITLDTIPDDDEIIFVGDCDQNYNVQYDFLVVDECLNVTSCSQTVKVRDTTAPEVTPPADATIECDVMPIPANTNGMATAMDNCDPMADVSFTDVTIEEDCGFTIMRTWKAVDDCGNMCGETTGSTMFVDRLITSPDDFSDEATLITFNEYNDGDIIEDQYAAMGVQFSAPAPTEPRIFVSSTGFESSSYLNNFYASNEGGNSQGVPITINFDDKQNRFGFYVGFINSDDEFQITLTCMSNNEVVGIENLGNPEDGEYIGIESSAGFDQVIVEAVGFDNAAFCMDQMRFEGNGSDNPCPVQIIRVLDTTAPVLEACAPNTTIECTESTDPSNTGFSSFSDNCSDPVVTFVDSSTPGTCPQERTITRTWTATDDCLNTTTCAQTINVEDSMPPVFTFCPEGGEVECDVADEAIGLLADATATDLCDVDVVVTAADVTVEGACPQAYTFTRTFTATDDCENTSTCSVTIEIVDTEGPTCEDAVVDADCDDDLSVGALGMIDFDDNCDDDVTVTQASNDLIIPGPCDQTYTIERFFVAKDACGNGSPSSCKQTINVRDDEAPMIECPDMVQVECDEVDTAMTGMASATDNCSEFVIEMDDVTVNNPECGFDIIRTFVATDACNNTSATCQQVIKVRDTTNPEIEAPADLTLECDDDRISSTTTGTTTFTYAGGDISWENSVAGTAIAVADIMASLPDGAVVTDINAYVGLNHSWNGDLGIQLISPSNTSVDLVAYQGGFSGNCSNQNNINATYDDDGVPFVCTGENDDDTAARECDEDYLDGAAIEGTVLPQSGAMSNFSMEPANGLWSLSIDDNFAADGGCLQAFSIEISWMATLDIPNVMDGVATASDNCSTPDVTFEDELIEGNCTSNFTIRRVWTATDDCGNTATDEQLLIVSDNTPPTIACAADVTAECDEVDAVLAGLAAPITDDNCSMVTTTFEDDIITTDCVDAYTIVRTYTATDECGNESTCSQSVVVSDNTAPMLMVGGDITIECDDDVPMPTMAGETSVGTFSGAVIPDGPNGVAEVDLEVSVDPNARISDVNLAIDIKHTWVTDLDIFLRSPAGLLCPITLAQDECGTGDDYDVIFDDEALVDVGEVCSPTAPAVFGSVRPVDPLSMFDGENPNGTWTVIVIDDEAILQGVIGSVELIIMTGDVAATDNCDDDVDIMFVDTEVPGECPVTKVITRTFTATDNCGNTSTDVQIITVIDTVGPVIECADDIEVNADKFFCHAEIDIVPPTFTDNCDEGVLDGQPTGVRSDGLALTDPYPVGMTTITWTITGDCSGKSDMCEQKITVIDSQPPTVICKKIAVGVNDDEGRVFVPDGFLYEGAFDNCGGDVTIEVAQNEFDCTDLTDDPQVNNVIKVEITATDEFGNVGTCFTDVKLQDNFDPVAVCQDITVTLDDQNAAMIVAGDVDGGSTDNTDACDLFLDIDITDFDAGDADQTVVVTLTATDLWGNTDDCQANVYVASGPNSGQLQVTAKVWLEGAMNASRTAMIPSINDILPNVQPYAESHDYQGTETATLIPADAIDWVLVQLRDPQNPALVLAERAGFLMSNGLIADVNGVDPINFGEVSGGNYYIAVIQRNHLAVLSNNSVSVLAGQVSFFDFTTNGAMGTESMKTMSNNEFALWCGDVNADGKIDAQDRNMTWNDRNKIGYFGSDASLNGTVDATDRNITWNNRNKVSGLPVQ